LKIVDVTEFYSERGGGIRSHLTLRGHFLCQLGHDHVVIAPGPCDEDAPAPTGVAPDERTSRLVRFAGPALPYDRTYHLLGRLDKIRERVRAESPDVLEAHSPYLASAAILASGRDAARIRTAFWHSDHVGTYVEPTLQRTLGPRLARVAADVLWQGVSALLSPFDATFVAGRAQANRLRAAGVPQVVHVPFGVDSKVFHPRARSEVERSALMEGGGEATALLVGVGRFAFEKRWDVVLQAFARVRERHAVALVLFGDGPERERLQARAPPGVRFVGFERDRAALAAALATADLLVHGCPYETFGIGVAEAVASGLPVVVPDAGGAADSADPACAQTYASLDANACAAAIERMLARDRVELRARAIEAAARVPTTEQHFASVLNAYGDLLRDKGR
jgi:alpha-1,6-mannosyltransferase